MQIQITSHDIDVSDALRAATEEKFSKIATVLDDQTAKAQIIFKIDHASHIAEGHVFFTGHTLHAHAESTDMYETISLLAKKLMTQAIKHKEKQL